MAERDDPPKYPITPEESRNAGRGDAQRGNNLAPQRPGESLAEANRRLDGYNDYKNGK